MPQALRRVRGLPPPSPAFSGAPLARGGAAGDTPQATRQGAARPRSPAEGPLRGRSKRLTDALLADIREGRLRPGDAVPPVRELARVYGTTSATVRRHRRAQAPGRADRRIQQPNPRRRWSGVPRDHRSHRVRRRPPDTAEQRAELIRLLTDIASERPAASTAVEAAENLREAARTRSPPRRARCRRSAAHRPPATVDPRPRCCLTRTEGLSMSA
ncbi:GntR family transcriptional regulator [Kitasatospora sp. NPDC096140]|uniref:GntR family transcriptional regulator n=1 Tax=Kitasatospora sp. NPDC096140 TaxID=3155425 RepID=UPI003323CBBD